ncbi:MAG: hypothetical protein KBE65_07960 [Phycisphaerae bacterium]|nr:hypothetical protein [Phycisphaerae bacterium]
MYELLVRIETLLLPLSTVILLGVGVTLLLVGLVFWLGGSRYSTVIVGLLGAAVGAVAGLLVSQWLGLHLWLCMIVGAAVLATASVMLRNVLILVLAVVVIAAVSGAGYLAVLLDRVAPADVAQPPSAGFAARTESGFLIQSFTNMDPNTRLRYIEQLTKANEATTEQNFRDRVRVVLDDTWTAVEPHVWKIGLAVLAGGLVAIFLVWLVKKALIALAYSVVGAATVFLGLQAALLGANIKAISLIGPRPWALPGTFVGMTALGWLWQLVMSRPKHARHEREHHHEHAPEHEHDQHG